VATQAWVSPAAAALKQQSQQMHNIFLAISLQWFLISAVGFELVKKLAENGAKVGA
jgi:hypothetical protein